MQVIHKKIYGNFTELVVLRGLLGSDYMKKADLSGGVALLTEMNFWLRLIGLPLLRSKLHNNDFRKLSCL